MQPFGAYQWESFLFFLQVSFFFFGISNLGLVYASVRLPKFHLNNTSPLSYIFSFFFAMEPFPNNSSFNPQRYGSNNIPQPADRLYSYSGYTAGLMTSSQAGPSETVMSNKLCSQSARLSSFQPPHPIPESKLIASEGITTSERYSGMYAATGFDILSVLSRVVNRLVGSNNRLPPKKYLVRFHGY